MVMPLLICEGPCNHGRTQVFDAMVEKTPRLEVNIKHVSRIDTNILTCILSQSARDLLRSLRYTHHVFSFSTLTGRDHYKCVECGATRVFGS